MRAAESGTIDVQELRAALQLLGQQPTLEELFIIISQVQTMMRSLLGLVQLLLQSLVVAMTACLYTSTLSLLS